MKLGVYETYARLLMTPEEYTAITNSKTYDSLFVSIHGSWDSGFRFHVHDTKETTNSRKIGKFQKSVVHRFYVDFNRKDLGELPFTKLESSNVDFVNGVLIPNTTKPSTAVTVRIPPKLPKLPAGYIDILAMHDVPASARDLKEALNVLIEELEIFNKNSLVKLEAVTCEGRIVFRPISDVA